MENWFVINIKPKRESGVERLFLEAGYTIYNPKVADGKSVKPFFPGYAFLRFDHPAQYRTVKYTRGVKKIVGNPDGPIPVPAEVVEGIRKRETGGLIVLEKYGQVPGIGDAIEVAEGPLKGLKGIFQREMDGNSRVLILLDFISYQGKLLIEKQKLRKAVS